MMQELSKKMKGLTDYGTGYYGLDIHRYNATHEAFTSETLNLKKSNDTVLDAGCGDGFWSNMLSKYYAHVTGIDLSLLGVETAKARYSHCDFEHIDFFDYNTKHDVIFTRYMSLQNSEIGSPTLKKVTDKLFNLAKKEVIYIERTTWPKLDPDYWCYKNPEQLYAYLSTYGNIELKKYTRNTVFVRVKK